MFSRGFSVDDVRHVIETGETIEDYPEDFPFPSRLILGSRGSSPVHVVVAESSQANELIVVTVYTPDPGKWTADFKRRLVP
jgi:hypothetical protein